MNRLKLEIRNSDLIFATVIAALFIFADFAVWCVAGSPMFVLRFISARVPVLPLWILGLCDFLCFALLGFSLGIALGNKCTSRETEKYKGAFYFVISVVLLILHHFLFFMTASFFAALIAIVLACAFLLAATFSFSKVSPLPTVLSIIAFLWLAYLFSLNLLSFFWA